MERERGRGGPLPLPFGVPWCATEAGAHPPPIPPGQATEVSDTNAWAGYLRTAWKTQCKQRYPTQMLGPDTSGKLVKPNANKGIRPKRSGRIPQETLYNPMQTKVSDPTARAGYLRKACKTQCKQGMRLPRTIEAPCSWDLPGTNYHYIPFPELTI